MKGLIGITPSGVCSFVSDLYTGSISDKEIIIQSGFLDKLSQGDGVMADKGFLIQAELAARQASSSTSCNTPIIEKETAVLWGETW